jgi:hypothetical protein
MHEVWVEVHRAAKKTDVSRDVTDSKRIHEDEACIQHIASVCNEIVKDVLSRNGVVTLHGKTCTKCKK